MENKDRTLTKVGWITKMKSTPPLTQEYIELQYLRFEIMVKFLQEKKMTTRIILKEDQIVNDDSKLMASDLTDKGRNFYRFGIIPWVKKIDRSKYPEKVIRDTLFLEKKLKDMDNVTD